MARRKGLFDFPHLGSCEVANLEREALQRGGDEREHREQLGVTVALQDLRRARRRLEPSFSQAMRSTSGGVAEYVPTAPAELSDTHAVEGVLDPAAVAGELERPPHELQPEGGRLSVHPVCPPDCRRVAMFLRALGNRSECAVDTLQNESACVVHHDRKRGVEYVRGREAVVEPATLGTEVRGDGVDESRDVVVRRPLEIRDPLRCRRGHLGPESRSRSPAGSCPPAPIHPTPQARQPATPRASPPRTRCAPSQASSSAESPIRF